MRIADLASHLRPREKALRGGIECLSEVELLALIIGSGYRSISAIELAQQLFYTHQGLRNLAKISHPHQMKTKGMGVSKSLALIAVFELARRLNIESESLHDHVYHPRIIFQRYQPILGDADQEQLIVLMFDKRMNLLKAKRLYLGTSSGFTIEKKMIFAEVLIVNAVSFILIHNHPSGNPEPSAEDIEATNEIRYQANRLGLRLIDHLIIAGDRYFAFSTNDWCLKRGKHRF